MYQEIFEFSCVQLDRDRIKPKEKAETDPTQKSVQKSE